jgi:excisionase family DNA binding protein
MTAELRYLTPSEAAAQLRVSTDTILRLITSGELPAIRVSARIIRIPVPAFLVFQADHGPERRAVVRRKVVAEVKLGIAEPSPDLQPA